MKLKLPEDIVSGEDLKDVIEELKGYKAYLHHKQILNKVSSRKSGDAPRLSEAAADLIAQARDGGTLKLAELDKLINELNEVFARSLRVKIILAAAPTPGIKKKLSGWMRDNVSGSLLIDFRYDSAILGGMIVVFGSHINDWSFRRQILESKDKLTSEFSAHV